MCVASSQRRCFGGCCCIGCDWIGCDGGIAGSGDVMTKELVASTCKIQISGSGDAAVYVNGDLETQISGSGDVRYRGNASVTAKISGSGEVTKL